jgi:hypothetical protein
MPTDAQRYGSVFVMQGSGDTPTQVIYLTEDGVDSKGNPLETVHVQKMSNTVTFTNPGSGAYIPFFIKDSNGNTIANPKAVDAVDSQTATGKCSISGQVSAMTAAACAAAGGTYSHN